MKLSSKEGFTKIDSWDVLCIVFGVLVVAFCLSLIIHI
jgi:hypothetical protein